MCKLTIPGLQFHQKQSEKLCESCCKVSCNSCQGSASTMCVGLKIIVKGFAFGEEGPEFRQLSVCGSR